MSCFSHLAVTNVLVSVFGIICLSLTKMSSGQSGQQQDSDEGFFLGLTITRRNDLSATIRFKNESICCSVTPILCDLFEHAYD